VLRSRPPGGLDQIDDLGFGFGRLEPARELGGHLRVPGTHLRSDDEYRPNRHGTHHAARPGPPECGRSSKGTGRHVSGSGVSRPSTS
jgi:hypothetical protein